MLIVPKEGPRIDTDAWTMLCMTDNGFWNPESYTTLRSPSLKSQSVYFIALALHTAAHRRRDLLVQLERRINEGDSYLSPTELQNSFFCGG